MNFNSLQYVLFLPAVVIIYFLLPKKTRNAFLLVSSFYFYMCWNARYALLMLTSIVVTYFCGRLISSEKTGRKRLWLALNIIANLGILFVFKYYGFFGHSLEYIGSLVGFSVQVPSLDLLLPVGISFYTFQALGYTIDVYRKDIEAERNFIDYALFVSFFPQLVAGPIERSGNILTQLRTPQRFSADNLRNGFLKILWGLFKKMVIADNLALIVTTVYDAPRDWSGGMLLAATLCFTVQIYCDFSAYTDIARGSAKILGIEICENFNGPYFARSIQDFWRRWHISLSTWFRDYLYFPLGGSYVSRARHCINIMIVFLVSGLWHGAAFTFVVWGGLHGLYQVIGILLKPLKTRIHDRFGEDSPVLHMLEMFITFVLVSYAWLFFRANTMADALFISKAILLVPANGLALSVADLGVSTPVLIMVLCAIAVLAIVDGLSQKFDLEAMIDRTVWTRYAIYFLILMSIFIFGYYGPGFDPQEFVYFQF